MFTAQMGQGYGSASLYAHATDFVSHLSIFIFPLPGNYVKKCINLHKPCKCMQAIWIRYGECCACAWNTQNLPVKWVAGRGNTVLSQYRPRINPTHQDLWTPKAWSGESSFIAEAQITFVRFHTFVPLPHNANVWSHLPVQWYKVDGWSDDVLSNS